MYLRKCRIFRTYSVRTDWSFATVALLIIRGPCHALFATNKQIISKFDITCYFRRVRKIAQKLTISAVASVCSSVRPHGTTRLPLDEFLWNLVFEYFSKICRQNSSFIKVWQE